MADFARLEDVLEGAGCVIAPLEVCSGVQSKVVLAVDAGLPVVVTPRVNEALGLLDGIEAEIVDRDADRFARSVARLLADHSLSERMAEAARIRIDSMFLEDTVVRQWRELVVSSLGPKGQSQCP